MDTLIFVKLQNENKGQKQREHTDHDVHRGEVLFAVIVADFEHIPAFSALMDLGLADLIRGLAGLLVLLLRLYVIPVCFPDRENA